MVTKQQHGIGSIENPSATKIMDFAVTEYQTGNIYVALGLFRQLKEIPSFEHEPECQLMYALCLQAIGRLDEAQRELQQVVKFTEAETTFRGIVLTYLSEISIAVGQTELAEKWLDEATRIFRSQRDQFQLSQVQKLKGVLAASNGDYEEAMTRITKASQIAPIYRGFPQSMREVTGTRTLPPVPAFAGVGN